MPACLLRTWQSSWAASLNTAPQSTHWCESGSKRSQLCLETGGFLSTFVGNCPNCPDGKRLAGPPLEQTWQTYKGFGHMAEWRVRLTLSLLSCYLDVTRKGKTMINNLKKRKMSYAGHMIIMRNTLGRNTIYIEKKSKLDSKQISNSTSHLEHTKLCHF